MPRASKVPKPVQIVQAACPESNRRVQPPGSSPGVRSKRSKPVAGILKILYGRRCLHWVFEAKKRFDLSLET
jgi:hypothetical protein